MFHLIARDAPRPGSLLLGSGVDEMRERVSYSVLEYMYRDAGNWKTYGAALLQGRAGAYEATIRSCLDPGELFVPEQVLLLGLHRRHWEHYGDGPSDMDHAFHEFLGLRDAQEDDLALCPPVGTTRQAVSLFLAACCSWDVRCSRYLIDEYSGWLG